LAREVGSFLASAEGGYGSWRVRNRDVLNQPFFQAALPIRVTMVATGWAADLDQQQTPGPPEAPCVLFFVTISHTCFLLSTATPSLPADPEFLHQFITASAD
jgi:hypothetical protein